MNSRPTVKKERYAHAALLCGPGAARRRALSRVPPGVVGQRESNPRAIRTARNEGRRSDPQGGNYTDGGPLMRAAVYARVSDTDRGLLPLPNFGLSITAFVGLEFENAGHGVETGQLRRGSLVVDRAAVTDGASLLEGAHARSLPGNRIAGGGHQDACAFAIDGPVGPDDRGVGANFHGVYAEYLTGSFERHFHLHRFAGQNSAHDPFSAALINQFAKHVALLLVPSKNAPRTTLAPRASGPNCCRQSLRHRCQHYRPRFFKNARDAGDYMGKTEAREYYSCQCRCV